MRVSDGAGGASGGVAVCVLVFAHGLRHLQRSCGCGSLDMPAGGGRGNGPFRPSDGLCRTGAAYGGYAAADLGVFLHFVFPAWGGSADFHRNDAVSAGGMGCMVMKLPDRQ